MIYIRVVAAVLKLREMAVAAKVKPNKPRNPSVENSQNAATAAVTAPAAILNMQPSVTENSNESSQIVETASVPGDDQANQQNETAASTDEGVDQSAASADVEVSEQVPPTINELECNENDGKMDQESMHEVSITQSLNLIKKIISNYHRQFFFRMMPGCGGDAFLGPAGYLRLEKHILFINVKAYLAYLQMV